MSQRDNPNRFGIVHVKNPVRKLWHTTTSDRHFVIRKRLGSFGDSSHGALDRAQELLAQSLVPTFVEAHGGEDVALSLRIVEDWLHFFLSSL